MNGSVNPAPFRELKIPPHLLNDGDLVGGAAYDQSFRGEKNKLLSAHSNVMPHTEAVVIMLKTICTIYNGLYGTHPDYSRQNIMLCHFCLKFVFLARVKPITACDIGF